jgi:hypothetical protein
MLNFNLESPTRLSLVEPNKTARAAVDRRAAAAGNQPPPATPRKRRRHDGLNLGKPVRLQW